MAIEVLIFGAGAIGAFYGSILAQNENTNVSVICRSNYKVVKSKGFNITSPQFGNYQWTPTRIYPTAEEAKKSGVKWNFVIVTTKALPDVSDDSDLLDGLIEKGTAILLIQNGLGVEEPYRRRYADAIILSAVTITSAAQPEHGQIKHNKWTRINSGAYPSDTPEATKRNEMFVHLLTKAGIKDASAYSAEKMQLLRWHKLAINAAMNPSSVLSGGTDNATMAKDPELSEHLKGIMDEIFDVAPKVTGSSFPPDFATAEKILESTRNNTSGSKPSMQLDWEGGKRMELEVILGNPIRLAREKGYQMPRMQAMYALLKMAQTRREQESKPKL